MNGKDSVRELVRRVDGFDWGFLPPATKVLSLDVAADVILPSVSLVKPCKLHCRVRFGAVRQPRWLMLQARAERVSKC